MCNTTQRTSFLAARANSKLNDSLLTVRSRIAKKAQNTAEVTAVQQPQSPATQPSTTTTTTSTTTTTTAVQQTQQGPLNPNNINGYNLVEKKKRKVRCGKEVGPQDQFMFHLKLEHETKKKRKNTRRKVAAPKQEEIQAPVLSKPSSTTCSPTSSTQTPQVQSSKPITNVIVSVIDAITQDNNVIPTVVTMVDGCVLKCNNAMNKLLAGTQMNQQRRSVIQNMLHPEDMSIHHIQLLKLLASNTDTARYDLRMLNADARAIKVTLEVICIRNDSALPQWLIMRVLSAQELDEYVRKELINQQQSNCKHEEFELVNQRSAAPSMSFYETFIATLEKMFHNNQPAMFFDMSGTIAWNNAAFDCILATSGRPLVGRKVLEVQELKGTPIDLMTRSIIVDQQEKLEAQISPTNLPALGSRQLKCFAQKIPNANGGSAYGYLWLFSVGDGQNNVEEQYIYEQMAECMNIQQQLQEQLCNFGMQQIAAAPTTTMDELPLDASQEVGFFLMNDVTEMDERALETMFAVGSADDKKFNYLDSHIVSFPQSHQDNNNWASSYDFFIDDNSSDTEIESIFATL